MTANTDSTADAPIVAIVDGYSTGNYLPAAFRRQEATLVHVRSTPTWMESMLLPDLEQYQHEVEGTDPHAAAEELKALGVTAVLAGQEPGVPLADHLSTLLGLPSNGTRHSAAKRDKFAMIETARSAGLRVADQSTASSTDEVRAWVEGLGSFPVVVKPLRSASTDGVFICSSVDEAVEAAAQVLTSHDIFGDPNHTVLVQSYLDGDEYIVDTVSAGGEHFIAGIWKYYKNLVNGKNIYDRDVLIDPESDEAKILIEYMLDILSAFEIGWGPTHTEIKLTSGGPALVEIGARVNGNMHPEFHNACLGHNQADLTALAFTEPERFAAEYGSKVYTMLQPAQVYNAPSLEEGTITGINEQVRSEIERLPSVVAFTVKRSPGQRLERTIDLLTSPLRVFMTSPSAKILNEDYQALSSLKNRLYEL